jgi:hypothetical protein
MQLASIILERWHIKLIILDNLGFYMNGNTTIKSLNTILENL